MCMSIHIWGLVHPCTHLNYANFRFLILFIIVFEKADEIIAADFTGCHAAGVYTMSSTRARLYVCNACLNDFLAILLHFPCNSVN